ncbi:MAG TPA: radical SAM protein [Desulfuromonadaceae bacterium]|jgi:radical SAM superfamily enzyme YgiQ (UPF0313 family)
MKILLTYISGSSNRKDPYLNLLPAGLCSLHACLRETGYDSCLCNFSAWSEAAIIKQLNLLQPDVIGISQWTHNRHASTRLAKLIRRRLPDSLIIMGGGHATFCYREVLGEASPVDLVVLGEGESAVIEIIKSLSIGKTWQTTRGIAFRHDDQFVVNPSAPLLTDLDRLPFASSYLSESLGIDIELQSEFILTARGCPSSCYFCSSPGFWERQVRFRSAENIVDEILSIRDSLGLIYFSLRDDTFTADRSRAIRFCRLLIERKAGILWNCQSRVTALDEELLVWMKRAGCECIQLGVESGSQRILSMLGKKITPAQVDETAGLIRKVGINLSIYLISDIPGETEEDFQQTVELIKRIRPDDGYVSPLAYYPGTRLFEEALANGLVDSEIFVKSQEPALFVAEKPGRGSRRLLKVLAENAPTDNVRFEPQKLILGYCYATNVLAGEWYRQSGNTSAAEKEFSEITLQEPNNPWGWYLLGELYNEMNKQGMAERCYRKVLAIVPQHKPSRLGLTVK